METEEREQIAFKFGIGVNYVRAIANNKAWTIDPASVARATNFSRPFFGERAD